MKRIPRRKFLQLAGMAGAGVALAGCTGGKPAPPATQAPASSTTAPSAPAAATINGVTLPADAAPPEYQTLVVYYDNTSPFTTMEYLESAYNRGVTGILDVLSDPLVRLDKNFDLHPGAALKWTPNADATQWTFELDPEAVWSDGEPLTADDYVVSFRHAADPAHAWDFAWYYSAPGAIKNWDAVLAGEKPLEELGIRAEGPKTLVIETESPAPFLPAKLIYSMPFQKKSLEALGPLYNNDPATAVSSGPFVLKEWTKGVRVVYEANPHYKGNNKALIQKIISIGAQPGAGLAGYQAGEIDYTTYSSIESEIVNKDPELSKQVVKGVGDFRCYYLFFDCQNPPFDDIRVRQAFSHVVDRDTLVQNIITPDGGMPAYSFLMPGYPGSNADALKGIQGYDPEQARTLLADAGYPGGQGFPKLTMWLRSSDGQLPETVGQAIAAAIKQELGIEVEVSPKDSKVFMDALYAQDPPIQFGLLTYGFDFLDPSNMLGIWMSGGAYNWNNAEFDAMVSEAAANTNAEARLETFHDAEKLLVTEAPAVFIYHPFRNGLIKPYIKGDEIGPNKFGNTGFQYPDYSAMSMSVGSVYVTSEVTKYRSAPPK